MLSRLIRATQGRSLGEIVSLLTKNVVHLVSQMTPRSRRLRAADRAFDVTWGTDTSGTVDLGALEVDLMRARHGGRYQASDGDYVLTLLDGLSIPYPEFTFVDFGCGKGRIVLVASLRPFRAVFGVEFSGKLASIASANVAVFQMKAPTVAPVHIANVDAATFAIPDGNLVLFFYNPFDGHVMSEVVANVESAMQSQKRDVRVIYVDPRCADVFDRSGRWRRTHVDGTLLLSAGVQ